MVANVQRTVPHFDQIIFRVKIVFNGHGAGNSGYVDIAFYHALIPSVGQAAGSLTPTVYLIGDVLDPVPFPAFFQGGFLSEQALWWIAAAG